MLRKWQTPLTVLLGIVISGLILLALRGHWPEFKEALEDAPYGTLFLAAALHAGALLARSETWLISVNAAGAHDLERRQAYQVASMGFAANIVTTSLGAALRIWGLRRVAPDKTPHIPALVAAEVPYLILMAMFGAAMSFTLVEPLGIPWWSPLAALGLLAGGLLALHRFASHHTRGMWAGLGVLLDHTGRDWLAFWSAVMLACEIGRNYLLLHAVGMDVTVLESIALLLAIGLAGILPVGPGAGAGAGLLIFSSDPAMAAAAGLLLTVTAIAGELIYAAWGTTDMLWRATHRRRLPLPHLADYGVGGVVVVLGVVALL